jgi:putative MATE family efflux protein
MDKKRSFYRTLLTLTIPIAIQQLFVSGLGMVDMMLVGQLGDTAIAAVGLAAQVYFILSLLYFGMSSGSAIFTAQFWGKQDKESIQKVLTLNLISNFTIGVLFTIISQIAPQFILQLFSNDPEVIRLGSQYLKIYSLGFMFLGMSYAFYTVLRSTENVKIPMSVGVTILSFNTLLGFVLIFGKLGFPALGVNGAAIANATSRFLELIIITSIIKIRKSTVVIRPALVFPISSEFIKRYLTTAMPVTINELIWSLGIAAYNSIYAHIGTGSITAINIASSIENLAFVPFIGLGNAAAIMIGKKIGANEVNEGIQSANRIIKISCITALVMGALILLNKSWILNIYKISDTAQSYAHLVLIVFAIALLVKSTNMIIIIGIIRAGGDTKYGLLVELVTMWLFGVPAAYIAANVFHLPVYWVVAVVAFEEVIKLALISHRFRSKKWVHHLTEPLIEHT